MHVNCFRKPKVSNFYFKVVHEKIGWLQISVDDLFLVQTFEATKNLLKKLDCLCL